MVGNKIANKIAKVSKTSQDNNSETVTNENHKEIPKERYISTEKGKELTEDLRLKWYNNGISKYHKSFKKFTTK